MINKNELQYVLEKDACKKNGGMCESYNYCKFCAEPKRIFRKSDTPCADAYIDMKDITKMLKNHIKDKEYIEVNTKKIEIWKNELYSRWDDEYLLDGWFKDLKTIDTFGMPKGTNYDSYIENEIINKEKIRNKIKEFIKLEEERLNNVITRYNKIEKAIDKLNEKDKFIIDCRYGEMGLNINDTITSFYKKYGVFLTIDQIKKKIAGIKKQIYKKMYKK